MKKKLYLISGPVENTEETFTGSAMKHEKNISVSERVKNEENISIYSGSSLSLWRSTHSTAGKFQSKRYMDEVFLTKIDDYSTSAYQSHFSYFPRHKRIWYLEKFIAQIQEYIQQSEMTSHAEF